MKIFRLRRRVQKATACQYRSGSHSDFVRGDCLLVSRCGFHAFVVDTRCSSAIIITFSAKPGNFYGFFFFLSLAAYFITHNVGKFLSQNRIRWVVVTYNVRVTVEAKRPLGGVFIRKQLYIRIKIQSKTVVDVVSRVISTRFFHRFVRRFFDRFIFRGVSRRRTTLLRRRINTPQTELTYIILLLRTKTAPYSYRRAYAYGSRSYCFQNSVARSKAGGAWYVHCGRTARCQRFFFFSFTFFSAYIRAAILMVRKLSLLRHKD